MLSPPIHPFKESLKRSRPVRKILQTDRYRFLRHRIVLVHSPRDPGQTYTRFYRVPLQFEALVGPVFKFLGVMGHQGPLTIAVVGCSNGAEAVSIASVINNRRPEVDFSVRALDNDPTMLKRAQQAVYHLQKVRRRWGPPEEFISSTFSVGRGTPTVRNA
jgi:chemotaxis methyl-accepting protein methylase